MRFHWCLEAVFLSKSFLRLNIQKKNTKHLIRGLDIDVTQKSSDACSVIFFYTLVVGLIDVMRAINEVASC